MDSEFRKLREYVEGEVSVLNKKIEKLEERVAGFEDISVSQQNETFSPDVSIVAINLPESANENLETKVNEMISIGLGLPEITAARVMRLKGRDGKTGIVKIQCYNKNDKIALLKAKQNLKDISMYKRVYLRSSFSHVERLARLNFETLLRQIPGGHRFRLAGNGRIISRDQENEDNQGSDMTQNAGNSYRGRRETMRGSYRGRGRGRVVNE
jgi:hypothetical protein